MSDDTRLRYSIDEFLASDDRATVLAFLAAIRPLEGVCYDDDDRFEHGRALILEWLEASENGAGDTRTNGEVPAATMLYECANVLYLLGNINPLRESKVEEERLQTLECGYHRVLDWLEKRMLRLGGFSEERPHKTAGEKVNAVYEELDAIKERESIGSKLN